jgi:hypothetical protein
LAAVAQIAAQRVSRLSQYGLDDRDVEPIRVSRDVERGDDLVSPIEDRRSESDGSGHAPASAAGDAVRAHCGEVSLDHLHG